MLENFDQGKVLAIKNGRKEGLIKYMCKMCDTTPQIYNSGEIYIILRNLYCEIIKNITKKTTYINLFLDYQNALNDKVGNTVDLMDANIESLITAINLLQIRENGVCINGFSEDAIKEFDNSNK